MPSRNSGSGWLIGRALTERIQMRTFLIACLITLLASPAYAADDGSFRLNLLQVQRTIRLNPENQKRIRSYFSRHHGDAPPGELVAALIAALPIDFRRACPAMIMSWGEIAAGTARLDVRILHAESPFAWLAYRCSSSRPEYKNFFDERLALLDSAHGTLEIFPFDQNISNDSKLFRIEYDGPVALGRGSAALFTVRFSTDNPCCGGPTFISGARLRIFLTQPDPHEALSLEIENLEDDHDDLDGDTETHYVAKPSFERAANGQVVAVSAAFRETQNGKPLRAGTLRYTWDPRSASFLPARHP
jgi:hypothetical protein